MATTPWIATDHAAAFAADLVGRLGRPLSAGELAAAESIVADLGGPDASGIGAPAVFASTMASALAAVEAGTIRRDS